MLFVQKLPALEPEMKGALRKHIIRKRRRLKQEQEQDAIEKRLKKEKESKHIQDAMTLDQIRDQLSVLETKLLSLRNEKHSLFVQLKQVLNDDNSKRKKQKSAPKSSDLSHTKPIHEDDDGASKCVIVKKEPLQEHQCTSRHFHGLEQNRLVHNLSDSEFSLSHNNGPSYIREANYNPSTSKRAYLLDPCVNGQITAQVASGNDLIEPRQSEQFVPTIIQPQMRNYNHHNNLTNLQGFPHYLMINNNISTQVPLATGFNPQPLDLNAHRLEYMLNHQKQSGIPIANLGPLYTTITPHILSGAPASGGLSNIRSHQANPLTLPDQLHINPSSNLAQFAPQVSTNVPYPMVNFLQFTDRHLHQ